jgi:hypothetical protein
MSKKLSDEEFGDAQKSAGVAARYRGKAVHLYDYIDKDDPFYRWVSDREAFVSSFRDRNLVIRDVSGHGQAVCNLLARALLLYGVPVRVVSLLGISEMFDRDFDKAQEVFSEPRVLVILGMQTEREGQAPKDPYRLEWILRRFHAEGKGFIFHTEAGGLARDSGWWTNSFVGMVTLDAGDKTV